MALVNGSILHYTDKKKFLKNLFQQNCRSEFGIISQDCSLCDPFKNCLRNCDPLKNMAAFGGRLFALCGLQTNSSKFLSSETIGQISKSFHRNVPWMTLFKCCSRNFDLSINMALVNGATCTL